jgi:ATP-dependent Clp protease, protease subunit
VKRKWYEFRAQAKGAAEIVIYDEIGAFGIPAKAFLDQLKALGPVAELTVRINSPGGSVFDGVAIYNALKRHDARVTAWIDGIAASIASMIAMAGDEVVMPENAMLVLHNPSGMVMGTAQDMRATADALDKMKAGMIAAYRAKSGREEADIEALMAAETWLSAAEAHALGFADRVEPPVRMAAHFDLSRFRNTPPPLAAITACTQEDDMPDPQRQPSQAASAAEPGTVCDAEPQAAPEEQETKVGQDEAAAASGGTPEHAQPARAEAAPEPALPLVAAASASPAAPVPQPSAQVIDLHAVRAEERRATLAYVSEVNELCALAGRSDLAAGFVAKATPVAQIRRALLEARAAEDEATAIRSQLRPSVADPAQPAIDTQAIYAARNQHCR